MAILLYSKVLGIKVGMLSEIFSFIYYLIWNKQELWVDRIVGVRADQF